MGYRMNTLEGIWEELNGPVDDYSFGLGMFTSAVAMFVLSLILDNWRRWLCALIVWTVAVRAKLPKRRLTSKRTKVIKMNWLQRRKAARLWKKIAPTSTPPSATPTSNNPTTTPYVGKHRNTDQGE